MKNIHKMKKKSRQDKIFLWLHIHMYGMPTEREEKEYLNVVYGSDSSFDFFTFTFL